MRSKSLFAFLVVAALGINSQVSIIQATASETPSLEREVPKKQSDLDASQSQKAVNLLREKLRLKQASLKRLKEARISFSPSIDLFNDYKELLDSEGVPTPVGLATWLSFENLLPSHIYDYTQGVNPYLLNIQPIVDLGGSQEKIFLVRVNKKALLKDENFNPNVQPLSEDWKTVFIFKVLKPTHGRENFALDVAEKGELTQVNSLDPRYPIISYAGKKRALCRSIRHNTKCSIATCGPGSKFI